MKNYKKVIGVSLALIFLFLLHRDYKNKNSWTLLVCKDKLSNNIECNDISYEISNFNSEKECLLEGVSRFSKEGFECGKGCKKEGELNICSVICNSAGCN